MLWDWDDSLSHEISQQLRIITCFCCSVCCQLFWNCCSCSYSYSLNWTWTLVDGLELFGNGCLVNLTWTWLWSYGRVCNFICLRSQCRVLSLWGLCCSVCGLFWNLWIFMERSCKHLQLDLEDSPNGTLEMHWQYLGWCCMVNTAQLPMGGLWHQCFDISVALSQASWRAMHGW